jgi:hypothetical protein
VGGYDVMNLNSTLSVLIFILYINVLIPVAVYSKAYVCGHLVAGIVGSNPTEGMNVYVLCLYAEASATG